MLIGIITVNDKTFHPNARLIEEAEKLGHEVVLINPYGITCCVGGDAGDAMLGALPITGAGKSHRLPDLVLPRQGAPMGEYGFVLLRQFAMAKVPLVNGLEGITISKHQYITLQQLSRKGLPVPRAFFVTRRQNFFTAVEASGGFPVVAKQVDGFGGQGVEKLENRDAADSYLERWLNPSKGLVVEPFIPHCREQRVLVAGGKVIGAMTLTPAPGQFKANFHQKAVPEAFVPDDAVAGLAIRAAKACRLEIAGVDMIMTKVQGPVILEVNYSPGFRGLELATGKNIAGPILEHAVSISGNSKYRNSK